MPKHTIAHHGWLVLDKPLGITSAQAVAKVKHLLRPEKIGHAGTLDPLASGILPLALGEATKTVPYMMDTQKTYQFIIAWGEERSTDDREGEVTAASDAPRPAESEILAVLSEFTGEIAQVPPQFSAIKVAGERAYSKARAGESVELVPRNIMIYNIKLLNNNSECASFEVTCGKGTYVRSLGRDIGRKLGCLGYISALRRTQVGKFGETGAISLDNLEKLVHSPPPYEFLLPLDAALDDILAFEVDVPTVAKIRQGMEVTTAITQSAEVAYARANQKVVALGRLNKGRFKPVRVFNY